jgi:hypothetical protein
MQKPASPTIKFPFWNIGMLGVVDRSSADVFQAAIQEPTFVISELVNGQQKVVLN